MERSYVFGLGDIHLEETYQVASLPKQGECSLFTAPPHARSKHEERVSGSMLNILTWIGSVFHVHVGALTVLGTDTHGNIVRKFLPKVGISNRFIRVSQDHSTSFKLVLEAANGDKCSFLRVGSIGDIRTNYFKKSFSPFLSDLGSFFITELNYIQTNVVLEALEEAKQAKVKSILVIGGEEVIDTTLYGKEVAKCVSSCDVLVLTEENHREIYQLIDTSSQVTSTDNVEVIKSCALHKIVGISLLAVISQTGSIYLSSVNNDVIQSTQINVSSNTIAYITLLAPVVSSLTVALYKHGFPSSQQDLDKLSSIIRTVSMVVVQSNTSLANKDYIIPNEKVVDQLTAKLGSIMFPGSACPLTGQNNPKNFDHMLTFIDSLRHDESTCEKLSNSLDIDSFRDFLDIIINCQGHIITSGIGKSGLVASRMSASLMSTGVPSFYVHAAEWGHGTLGGVIPGKDIVIFLSHSGRTAECVTACKWLKSRDISTLTITGRHNSLLHQESNAAIVYGLGEVDIYLGGAPTSSILLQGMIINAIIRQMAVKKEFTCNGLKLNHPGSLLKERILSQPEESPQSIKTSHDGNFHLEKRIKLNSATNDIKCSDFLDDNTSSVTEFKISMQDDIAGIRKLMAKLNTQQANAFINVIDECKGHVILTGVGKSGQVARRMSASLVSTGTQAFYIHASEWGHGDMGGAIPGEDVVLFISHGGNTAECTDICHLLLSRDITTMAIVGNYICSLSELCHHSIVYDVGSVDNFIGGLPTTSILLQEMVVNAIVAELISRSGYSKEEFALNHPKGALGESLNK